VIGIVLVILFIPEGEKNVKKKCLYLFGVIVFVSVGTTQAALWDRGGGLIYNDALDVTYMQNANYAGQEILSYVDAEAWVESLEYYDSVRNETWDDWRLPSLNDLIPHGPTDPLGLTDLGYLYRHEGISVNNQDPFYNIQTGWYWFDSINPYADEGFSFDFRFGTIALPVEGYEHDMYVWAVRDG